MTTLDLVLTPTAPRTALFDWVATQGFVRTHEINRTFHRFAATAWKIDESRTLSYVEVHSLGFRMVRGDLEGSLRAALQAAVPLLDRAALLAMLHAADLDDPIFALRALSFMECAAPSAELVAALQKMAAHDMRSVRLAVFNLLLSPSLFVPLAETVRTRATEDVELAEVWQSLIDVSASA